MLLPMIPNDLIMLHALFASVLVCSVQLRVRVKKMPRYQIDLDGVI